MVFRSIRDSELGAWVKLCADGFAMPPDEFYEHFIYDPDADAGGVLVAEDGGRLVSSVRVFSREIYINGENVKCGAIGEVCTLPEYRGRGLNAALLRLAVRYMEERAMSVSLLFTGINAYYEKYGWFTVPRGFTATELTPAPLENGYSLRAAEESDADTLAALYGRHNRRFNGVISREKYGGLYWHGWMKRNEGERKVLCRGGDVLAYLDYKRTPGALTFREFTGPGELFKPAFSAVATEKTVLREVPPALAPYGTVSGTSDSIMARLNLPFNCGGTEIGSGGKLAKALENMAFFMGDYF